MRTVVVERLSPLSPASDGAIESLLRIVSEWRKNGRTLGTKREREPGYLALAEVNA